MAVLQIKEGFSLKLKGQFLVQEKGKITCCPYCGEELVGEDLSGENGVFKTFKCPKCEEILVAKDEGLEELLKQEALDTYIPIFKEKKILNASELIDWKKKDYEALGITDKKEVKRLIGLFRPESAGSKGLVGALLLWLIPSLFFGWIGYFIGSSIPFFSNSQIIFAIVGFVLPSVYVILNGLFDALFEKFWWIGAILIAIVWIRSCLIE